MRFWPIAIVPLLFAGCSAPLAHVADVDAVVFVETPEGQRVPGTENVPMATCGGPSGLSMCLCGELGATIDVSPEPLPFVHLGYHGNAWFVHQADDIKLAANSGDVMIPRRGDVPIPAAYSAEPLYTIDDDDTVVAGPLATVTELTGTVDARTGNNTEFFVSATYPIDENIVVHEAHRIEFTFMQLIHPGVGENDCVDPPDS